MRFLQNDERFGVDLADNRLQLRGLPPPKRHSSQAYR